MAQNLRIPPVIALPADVRKILLTGFETHNSCRFVDAMLSKPATIDSLRGAIKSAIAADKQSLAVSV